MIHKYTLIRSKRKSVAIYLRPDLTIEVRAPLKMPKANIDKFVVSKENWINKKLLLLRNMQDKKTAFNLNYGDTVLALGKECFIVAGSCNQIDFDNERFYIPPNLTAEQIKHSCVQIYKLIAKQVLLKRTVDFAKLMSVMPSAIKISSAKTRWGSCSAQKNINYSWRLIMAENDVIDYVIVHELAHITEMNHSDRFWAIVAGILPDYKTRRKQLKILQLRLSNEHWQ